MRRATLRPLLLALVAACGGGGEDGDATGDPATGPGTSSPATGSEPAPTSTGDEVPGTDTSSGPTGTDDTSGADSGPPPPECGPLTTCGVQCVDLQTDPANCGKCGVSCVIPEAAPACAAGVCAVATCEPGHADCDGDVNNGCEAALPPGQPCPFMCTPGAVEACNLLDDNCDGQCDEGGVPGCRQPVHRASSPTLSHFYTLDLNEAMSGDLTVEAPNYFYTYVAQQPGLVPFYRCLKGNGKRFYTTSDICEGAGPSEGILGYVAGGSACGSIPLFRLYKGVENAHFYTISEAERDNAVSMYGYTYESVAGYVWPGP
jgi:hypothetical protein